MKKVLSLLLFLQACLLIQAQESALSISELPNLNSADEALGSKAQVSFLSEENNPLPNKATVNMS